jgi:GNAT superfamily N-acetyltransferase
VSRGVVGLTLDNLDELPTRCRTCVFWELAPGSGRGGCDDAAFEKEAWLSAVLLQWGCCGQLAYSDASSAGYACYAPPGFVPRAGEFPTAPVTPDAILLTTLRVLPAHAGTGLGRLLVSSVVGDLSRRGVRALEAFGETDPGERSSCVVPADFLRSVGFRTIRAHERWPLLRMDLDGDLSWKEDVAEALERLLGEMKVVRAS